jgi:hypothetical protein
MLRVRAERHTGDVFPEAAGEGGKAHARCLFPEGECENIHTLKRAHHLIESKGENTYTGIRVDPIKPARPY